MTREGPAKLAGVFQNFARRFSGTCTIIFRDSLAPWICFGLDFPFPAPRPPPKANKNTNDVRKRSKEQRKNVLERRLAKAMVPGHGAQAIAESSGPGPCPRDHGPRAKVRGHGPMPCPWAMLAGLGPNGPWVTAMSHWPWAMCHGHGHH